MIKNVLAVFLFLIVSFSLSTSCSSTTSDITNTQPGAFFDLKTFFNNEIERLATNNTRFSKKISFNQKMEEQTITDFDFEDEFAVFTRSDINKPAWSDKYRIDSTFFENNKTLTYTALDSTLRTRILEVVLNKEGNVIKIGAENQMQSVLANIQERFEYTPTEGYFIQTTQDNKTAEKAHIKIAVAFLNDAS